MARTIEVLDDDTITDLSAPEVTRAVQELVEAQAALKAAQKRVDVLKTWLKDAFEKTGGTVGMVADIPIASNRMTATFAKAKFAKDRPDLAVQYTVQVIKEELDVPGLRKDHPALYGRYRSRMLLIDDEGLALAAAKIAKQTVTPPR